MRNVRKKRGRTVCPMAIPMCAMDVARAIRDMVIVVVGLLEVTCRGSGSGGGGALRILLYASRPSVRQV